MVHRPGRAHANADTLSQRDACLGLTRGTPGLLLRVGVCGNPAPADLEKTRQRSEQRPLYGQVVQGRYVPFNTAVTASGYRRYITHRLLLDLNSKDRDMLEVNNIMYCSN